MMSKRSSISISPDKVFCAIALRARCSIFWNSCQRHRLRSQSPPETTGTVTINTRARSLRRQQSDATAKTGPIQGDPVRINTGPRGQKLKRMSGGLDLLVGCQPAAYALAAAKAAIVEAQHGIAMRCEPGRQTHGRSFLGPPPEAEVKHYAGATVVGRVGQIELSG